MYCTIPFKRYMHSKYMRHACCESWLNTRSLKTPLEGIEAFDSDKFNQLRDSILDQSYRFCSDKCPARISGEFMVSEPPVKELKEILLVNDASCNLKCKSCRDGYITQNNIHEINLLPYEHIIMSGNGDPFASEYTKNILANETTCKYISIQTNGLLFDIKYFHESNIEKLHTSYISIDASTNETYKKVRGASFSLLNRKIDIMRDYFKYLQTNFTISKYNIHEIEPFIEYALQKKFDVIYFYPIFNWNGSYDEMKLDEFDIESIHMIKSKYHDEKIRFGI